jgi:hypothetical protein
MIEAHCAIAPGIVANLLHHRRGRLELRLVRVDWGRGRAGSGAARNSAGKKQ